MAIEDSMGTRTIACNHSPALVGPNFCRRMSSVPAHAGKCVGCTSSHKATDVAPVADPEDGLPTTSARLAKMGSLLPRGGSSLTGMESGYGGAGLKRGNE